MNKSLNHKASDCYETILRNISVMLTEIEQLGALKI